MAGFSRAVVVVLVLPWISLPIGCSESVSQGRDARPAPADGASVSDTGDAHPRDQSGLGDAADVTTGSDSLVVATGTLSQQYPGDQWDPDNPALIFASNFEDGLGEWSMSSYTGDTWNVINDAGAAHSGNQSLKLSFTLSGLQDRGDASVSSRTVFTSQSGIYYVRYYMRYQVGTARPHHANGTRMFAPGQDIGGQAGLRPPGDGRFNTTIDTDAEGRHFFYTYWHEMRSGRCNDGTAVPGCAGDQGVTYYYGNNFKPANQTIIDRYQWNCYEYRIQANTPNQYDGQQALWINDALVGEFKTGTPMGAWLRSNFYTMGEWGTGDRQVPFEGYNFRTSTAVNQVRVSLQFYQERGTLNNNRDDTPNKTEEQAVHYDDVVIATERIGCRAGG